ncbi:sugar phosphate isomerase/epimerase [Paenibacillus rhizovicinus]|uniref:Sugar phosphate isomerase/epimerase n=1 Tax=Paenibacillus rhizovicinus TaxID=2704463 RepID=A0A6C0P8J2_9BACL|nr:sugar phosphate isomerase/epimerase family protein [Paenibacillus rhizovicinus]QHW34789.1 sugar phosphate isomerase/epimerase [Paenibacillus rhizovicinus]
MKLAINTLGCPDWTWAQIMDEAVRLGYDGIEVRGIQDELLLTKCEPFLPERLEATKDALRGKGLTICCLSTSCSFHAPHRYEDAIQEGKDAIDLAERLGVPYIRVFGDAIPDKSNKEATIAAVAAGLQTLGAYAESKPVRVLIETHGDFADHDDLLAVLSRTQSPAIGVLWDIQVTFKHNGQLPAETYAKLGSYMQHVHVKDFIGSHDSGRICLPGEGDVPIEDCLALLREHGYDGYYSFEWEKRWHPEIDGPEVAFPAFIRYMSEHAKKGIQ